MMANPTDIVGYTYKADMYCPRCALKAIWQGWHKEIADDIREPYIEGALDLFAAVLGIERDDESTFDSAQFPKVVYRNQTYHPDAEHTGGLADHCGSCGEILDG